MHLLTKIKKILYIELRATLNFRKFKEALNQLAAQTIETWQPNSSIENTPATIKILFAWQLTH